MVDAVIRIFESTATSFTTNGLGYLPDAISCVVIEERNGSFELEMVYPITGVRYSELMTRRLLLAKSNPFSEPQPFRIYEITKPINGKVTVYAEHISYDLSGIPVKPFATNNVVAALKGLKDNAMITCPFTFETDKSTTANYSVPLPTSIRSELAGIEGSILDVYRGEYEFDVYKVKLWNNRGADRGVTIRYGKNMTDLEQDENIASLYTGILTYWYSDMDEEDGGGYVQGDIVNCPGTYNFRRIMVLDASYDFQNKPTKADLNKFAESYISNNDVGIPKVSIEVSFVNLTDSQEYENLMNLYTVRLCDTVTVEYTELGVKATGKCIKTKYDVIEDRYDSISIGDAKATLVSTLASGNDKLAETFQKQLNTTSSMTTEEYNRKLGETYTKLTGQITAGDQALQEDLVQADKDLKTLISTTAKNEATARDLAIANATKLITGNLGGYVVIRSSTGGDTPDELLIMDTPDVATAKKVWRWNSSGLGYSNSGYSGPYGLAITQDGSIVANYIKTGEINASLITAGHMSASIIQGGTLILGGKSNGNGTFILRDNNNNTIGLMSNAGFTISKGTISGPSITVGGVNNQEGSITVSDSAGKTVGRINNKGFYMLSEADAYAGVELDADKLNLVIKGVMNNFNGAKAAASGLFSGVRWDVNIASENIFRVGPIGTTKIVGYAIASTGNFFAIGNNSSSGQFHYYYCINMWGEGGDLTTFTERHIFREGVRFQNTIYFGQYMNTDWTSNIYQVDSQLVIAARGGTVFKNALSTDYVNIFAKAFVEMSSRRYKENITPMSEEDAKKILELEPINFDYKEGYGDKGQSGLIVEDVESILPNICSYAPNEETGDDELVGIAYSKLTPYLIKIVQMQQKQIDALTKRIEELEKR